MDETYLQAAEPRPLPPPPIQAHHAATQGSDLVIEPTRRAADYSLAMRAMHWASVVLCLGAFLVAWAIGSATDDEAASLVMVHRSLSVTLLALIGLRLAWRQGAQARSSAPKAPAVPRLAARASVAALYFLLAALPLMGLAASMLDGSRIVVFGVVQLPSLLAVNEPLARQVLEFHGWAALLLLALIGLHIGTALRHRFGDLLASRPSGPKRPHHPPYVGSDEVHAMNMTRRQTSCPPGGHFDEPIQEGKKQ
jgi:superoxide oxidase